MNTNESLVDCPKCGVKVKNSRLAKHIGKVHASRGGKPASQPHLKAQPPKPLTRFQPGKVAPEYEYSVVVTVDEHGFVQSASTRKFMQPRCKPMEHIPSVVCHICGKSIRVDRRQDHLLNAHPKSETTAPQLGKSARDGLKCPKCSSFVGAKRLMKHLMKVHHLTETAARALVEKASEPPLAERAMTRKDRSGRDQGKPQGSTSLRPRKLAPRSVKRADGSEDARIAHEALHQSFDEPRDSSKYWGHMRREGGKFGSHPIFDDYGEESEA
jgi:uncharacterized C2H2 Zn-finger protein